MLKVAIKTFRRAIIRPMAETE